MKQVTVYNWRMKAETHGGKVYRTRHKLTEEDALRQDPDAVKCEGTAEVWNVYEPGDPRPAGFSTGPLMAAGGTPYRPVTWVAARVTEAELPITDLSPYERIRAEGPYMATRHLWDGPPVAGDTTERHELLVKVPDVDDRPAIARLKQQVKAMQDAR